MVGSTIRAAIVTGSLLLVGCIDGLTQVAGTGAIYQTRCSGDMVAEDGEYRARCEPEACAPGFDAGPVSHVVVTMDPGRKIVGYAERVCIQDLSRASARFVPAGADPGATSPPATTAAAP